MVKFLERNIYLDNVKGLLIFFVVIGHMIEGHIYNSIWFIPYLYIYIFHMPLFIFISGYFSKKTVNDQVKIFSRFLLPFFVSISLGYVVQSIFIKRLNLNFLVNYGALWYFLSLFIMCLLLPIVIKIRCNILILFFFSLVIGFFSASGTFLSLSRTICFFGYFLLGYYCPISFFSYIKNKKIPIVVITLIISILLYFFFTSRYGLQHIRGIVLTLLRSDAYKDMEIGQITGLLFRAITIPLSILFGVFVLACTPEKLTILSYLGRASVIIYIFHVYYVSLFWRLFTLDEDSILGMAIIIISSIGITVFLSIPVFKKMYNRCMIILEKIIILA